MSEAMNDWICAVCGKRLDLVNFEAWIDQTNMPGPFSGVWSCVTPGCSGNVKEFHEKRLRAMLKLTDEEKQLLGLWRYPEPVVQRNAFGRWLHRIFHV